MDTVICKEVIISTLKRRGDGKSTPIRIITEVYEKDGTLIAENDPSAQIVTREELREVLKGGCVEDSYFDEWFEKNFKK